MIDLFEGVDPAAQAAIRSYCGWHIAPVVTTVVTLDGSGGSILLLPTLKLITVDNVSVNGAPVNDFEWSEAGMLRRDRNWPRKFRSIEVTFSHGYREMPAALTAVLNRLQMVQNMPSGTFKVGNVSATTQGPSVRSSGARASSGDSYCDAILDRFRLPEVA